MENVISAKIYMPRIPSLTWAFEQTELDVHKGLNIELLKKTKTDENEKHVILDQSSHIWKNLTDNSPPPFFSLIKVNFFLEEVLMKCAFSCLLKVKCLMYVPLAAPKRIATIMNEWSLKSLFGKILIWATQTNTQFGQKYSLQSKVYLKR